MVDFKTFKKSSEDIERLAREIEKINKPQNTFEDRNAEFWKPTPDKAGNAYAVIRFLPEPAIDGDDGVPWVRVFNHAFRGPMGTWYIENSLTTLGQKDPVGEYNSIKWKEGDEETARNQKRTPRYYSNIRVIEDAGNPENNGKDFPYRFGSRIFRKIEEAIDPTHDADGNDIPGSENLVSVNPFDFWKGATFKFRMKTVKSGDKKFPNYDDSAFVRDAEGQIVVSALSNDEAELERVWKSLPSVRRWIAPTEFKTYDELKAKFEKVIGISNESSFSGPAHTNTPKTNVATKVKTRTIEDDEPVVTTTKVSDTESPFVDDDDDLALFQKLANS